MKSSETCWNEFVVFADQTPNPDLIKEHAQKLADAVAYECQKHVLTNLLDHARGHREGSAATGPVDAAWAHEIEYIEKHFAILEDMFHPKVQEFSSLGEILAAMFPHLKVTTLDELLGSAEPAPEEPVAGHDFAQDAKDYAEDGAQGRRDTYEPVVNEALRANFKATHVHHKTNGMYMHVVDASDEETGNSRSIYCNEWGHTFDRPAEDFHDETRFGKIS